ncbi:MAG: hypothetical protein FJ275_04920 [Planctomycetes bacterium]|nr:hypothetical protein [Planctomycetota bacterium]
MSSIVQVILTRLSDGAEFEGMAWCDGGRYEAIWNESGLRHVFHFREDGRQIGQNRYTMRRADT